MPKGLPPPTAIMATGIGWLCALAIALAAAMVPGVAHAQYQRSMINPGFESNDPLGPGTVGLEFMPNGSVLGWDSTSGTIEIWDNGHEGISSYEGVVFAEMNAHTSGALYQNICLVNGDIVRWTFAHRARPSGTFNQTARFEIASSAGTVLQTLATQTSNTSQSWMVNSNMTGVAFTGATGIRRLQFSTSDSGSIGNFLDGIHIYLNPFLEFSAATGNGGEATGATNMPTLYISGDVTTAFNVTITVTGGTATLGSDYTTPSGTATFTVPIAIGNYNHSAVPIGISIINDTAVEANETIAMTITTTPAIYTITNTTTCGGTGTSATTYTINDNDARLTMRKQWAGAVVGDDATLSATRSGVEIDNFPSDAGTANELDTDPTPTIVAHGDVVTLAETMAGGNSGYYIGTTACTGTSDSNLADGLSVGTSDTAIICTFTNTRSGMQVTKTSSVISDGINMADPRALPGATVRYCILVTNIGQTTANSLTVADPLPPQTDYVAGSILSGASCATAATVEDDDLLNADE
ncbi:MAG: hypothetical protein ACKOUM_05850, partial [Sphingopyxis sp.]